jgi:hypothetical protein
MLPLYPLLPAKQEEQGAAGTMKCVSDDDLHPVPNTSLLKILRWSFGADG